MAKGGVVGRIPFSFVAIAGLSLAAPASAAQDIGFPGPSYVGSGSFPTGTKPQSKLWFHAGQWWGSLWSEAIRRFTIHRLDTNTQLWTDTGTIIDPRFNSHSDCMSDGNRVYVLTHRFTTDPGLPGNPIGLFRFVYVGATNTYALEPGFPVQVGDFSGQTAVVEKDSTGRLWAVWNQGLRVWLAHSVGNDLTWVAPFQHPMSTTDVTQDDISSVIRFGGNQIGVMWSDQVSDAFLFSVHQDGTADGVWSVPEIALAGPGIADNHICLKSTADGRVFAIVKTGPDEIRLLVRSPAGTWTGHTVAEAAAGWSRPIVVLDEQARRIHAFATLPILRGDIVEKVSPLDAIGFGPGWGVPVIRESGEPSLNDATSVKRSVNAQSGVLVVASDQASRRYWHHHSAASGGPYPQPAPDFSGEVAGFVPLGVQFTDLSGGPATSRLWRFGDGAFSVERDPLHAYAQPGTYDVTLVVSDSAGRLLRAKQHRLIVGPGFVTAVD